MRTALGLLIVALGAVFLSACGGGGGGDAKTPVDTTPPTADVSPPSGATMSGSGQVFITFDESMDPASLSIGGDMAGECDGGVWSTNVHEDDTLTISPSVAWLDGAGTLIINASDPAGNPLAELSLAYTVDATLPTATASPANGAYLGSSQGVIITFDEPMNTTTLVLGGDMAAESDGGSWSPDNMTLTIRPTISPATSWTDGARTLTVDAEDTVGYTVTLSLAYTVDTTAPTATASPASGSYLGSGQSVVISFDEPMNTTTLVLGGNMASESDGGAWSGGDMTLTISPAASWADGARTLTVYAEDKAGHAATLSLAYTVDSMAPTATASPASGSYLGSGQSVEISFNEPMNTTTLVLGGNMAGESDGGAWSGGDMTLAISPVASWADGARTLTVDAEDTSGHAATLNLSYAVGAVAHTVSALYNTNGAEWNDYVINDGTDEFSASDTACTGGETGGYDACLHGGEMRVVEVTGKSACTGLTATDALGAFDWTCVVDAGAVKMVSTGLSNGKNLSDLLDFTTPGWKDNSATVLDGGVEYFTTVPAAWWTNPVVVDNDGGYLNAAGTIYVVKNDLLTPATGGYIINASSVGLVGRTGVIINGPSAGVYSHVISANGSVDARDFLWLEGAVDAAGDDVGVYLREVRFSVLRDVTVEHADTGIRTSGVYLSSCSNNTLTGVTATNDASNTFGISLISSSDNTLSGVTASDNTIGVYLYDSSNNTLTGVTASNNSTGVYASSSYNNRLSVVTASNGSYGVYLLSSSGNTLSGVTASHNGTGIYLYSSSDNTLSRVTSANNNTGVYLYNSSNNNRFSGVTVSNNSSGIVLFSASNNVLSGVAASNNAIGVYLYYSTDNTLIGATASNNTMGFNILNSSNNTLAGLTAANNNLGIQVSSSNNYFTELLKVGSNSVDCSITNSIYAPTLTDPGLDDDDDPSDVETDTVHDGKCVQEGTSDFGSATTGVDISSSFVGKTYGDAVNSSDTGGAVGYPTDPASFDWAMFENTYRGWGLDGAFDSSSQGQWTTGSGAIWDWSLSLGDTGDAGNPAILGVLSLPTGDETLTHTWSDATTTTLLRNAVEIQGDGLGNENTLCETGETCLFTPNIGSYQGHGNLESAGAFTDGDPVTGITSVTLMKYETNGY